MSILVQTQPLQPEPQTPYAGILYTNDTSAQINTTLFVTCIGDTNVPSYTYKIPMTDSDMYSVAMVKSKDIQYDDTCSIAILPSGVTAPTGKSNFILFQSQIGHLVDPLNISLGVGESIFIVSYKGYLAFTLTIV